MKIGIISILLFFLLSAAIHASWGPIEFDKDMFGHFEIDIEFMIINHKGNQQHMLFLHNYPENKSAEQLLHLIPIPAAVEGIDIDIFKSYPNLQGLDAKLSAYWMAYTLFWFTRNWQVYVFPLMCTNKMQPTMYDLGMYISVNHENERLVEYEKSLDVISAKERLKMTALSASLFDSNAIALRGITVHNKMDKYGLRAILFSIDDMEALSSGMQAKGLEMGTEYQNMLKEYAQNNYRFLIYGISNLNEYNYHRVANYVLRLIKDGKIEQAKEVTEKYSEMNQTDPFQRRVLNSLWTPWDSDTFNLKRLNRLKLGLFENHSVPSIYVSFPSTNIYCPMKHNAIYGNKKVVVSIYILDHISQSLPSSIKRAAVINHYNNYFDLVFYKELISFFEGYETRKSRLEWINGQEVTEIYSPEKISFTKLKIIETSNEIKDDLFLSKSQGPGIRLANFINSLVDKKMKGNFTLSFSVAYLLLCLPLSVLTSLISGLLLFRKSQVPKWMLAAWGAFNILSFIGFIMATFFLRTKSISTEERNALKECENIEIKSIRKKHYRAILVFFLLATLWLLLRMPEYEWWLKHFHHASRVETLRDYYGIFLNVIAILTLIMAALTIMILSLRKIAIGSRVTEGIDIKQFFFLLAFNLAISVVFLFRAIFERYEMLFKFNLSIPLMLAIFIVSIGFSLLFDLIMSKKAEMRGIYLVKKDKRKYGYIVGFTVCFLILSYALQYAIKMIIY